MNFLSLSRKLKNRIDLMNEKNMPLLQEIKVITIAAENIDIVDEWFATWVDYKVCE